MPIRPQRRHGRHGHKQRDGTGAAIPEERWASSPTLRSITRTINAASVSKPGMMGLKAAQKNYNSIRCTAQFDARRGILHEVRYFGLSGKDCRQQGLIAQWPTLRNPLTRGTSRLSPECVPGPFQSTHFRRTEMHHPYGTQEGEISFQARPNTRYRLECNIIDMHQNATVAQWYKDQPPRVLCPFFRSTTHPFRRPIRPVQTSLKWKVRNRRRGSRVMMRKLYKRNDPGKAVAPKPNQ